MNQNEEKNHPTIKPAEISLTATAARSPVSESRHSGKTILVWLTLAILITAVAGVVFVLPQKLQQGSQTAARPSAETGNSTATAPVISATSQVSPWTEAQLARQRKETQEILSLMLEKQEQLEELNVNLWAGEAYASAKALAESGDVLYRQRNFEEARSQYQQGLDALTALLERSESVFEENITAGLDAIQAGDAIAAKTSFDLALAIHPESERANRGRQRAETLDEVITMLAEGEMLLDEARFGEAEQIYIKILDIDPDTELAKSQLEYTRQNITDNRFTAQMSAGFASLEQNRFDAAHKSFTQALKIKPASTEARNALQQVETKLTDLAIKSLLDQAETAEANENWEQASGLYTKALGLDPNLAVAQSGKQYAEMRTNMDQRLDFAIANPLRLINQNVYNETADLFRQAIQLPSQGSRLRLQLASLKKVIEESRLPVTVTFRSNNQTAITLYRVGDLGQFESKRVNLIPGDYVAVGTRHGYQDVRVEFAVAPQQQGNEIMIACEEEISF